MHWLSLVTLVLLLVFAVAGWRAGLIRRVLEFVGVVASVLLASRFGHLVAEQLEDSIGLSDRLAGPVGWLLLFATLLVLTRLAAWALSKALRVSVLGWLDKAGGTLLGLLIGTLVASVLLMLATRLPVEDDLAERIESEPVTRIVHGAAPALYGLVVRDGKDDLERLWERAKDGLRESDAAADAVRDAVADRLDGD